VSFAGNTVENVNLALKIFAKPCWFCYFWLLPYERRYVFCKNKKQKIQEQLCNLNLDLFLIPRHPESSWCMKPASLKVRECKNKCFQLQIQAKTFRAPCLTNRLTNRVQTRSSSSVKKCFLCANVKSNWLGQARDSTYSIARLHNLFSTHSTSTTQLV